jgi:hypothetical protein
VLQNDDSLRSHHARLRSVFMDPFHQLAGAGVVPTCGPRRTTPRIRPGTLQCQGRRELSGITEVRCRMFTEVWIRRITRRLSSPLAPRPAWACGRAAQAFFFTDIVPMMERRRHTVGPAAAVRSPLGDIVADSWGETAPSSLQPENSCAPVLEPRQERRALPLVALGWLLWKDASGRLCPCALGVRA